MSRGARKDRSKPVRERRCIVTGTVDTGDHFVRMALGPDGVIVPDIAARLPGRGAWISADRAAIDKAVAKGLFNRAFERPVNAPEALADQVEALLEARTLSILGLARRAGRLAVGFDAVRLALGGKPAPIWRIEAHDGARDGRAKLDGLARHVAGLKMVSCFSADALGAALGRSGVVHAALAAGPEAERFSGLVGKLAGFRQVNPLGLGAQGG